MVEVTAYSDVPLCDLQTGLDQNCETTAERSAADFPMLPSQRRLKTDLRAQQVPFSLPMSYVTVTAVQCRGNQ